MGANAALSFTSPLCQDGHMPGRLPLFCSVNPAAFRAQGFLRLNSVTRVTLLQNAVGQSNKGRHVMEMLR